LVEGRLLAPLAESPLQLAITRTPIRLNRPGQMKVARIGGSQRRLALRSEVEAGFVLIAFRGPPRCDQYYRSGAQHKYQKHDDRGKHIT